MNYMKLTIGEKFQFLRGKAQKTETEIAEQLKLNLTTYNKMEEDFLYPADHVIRKVASLYDMTYEAFLAVGEE
jgi:transcriptional regulator with XRE-family HTH domain